MGRSADETPARTDLDGATGGRPRIALGMAAALAAGSWAAFIAWWVLPILTDPVWPTSSYWVAGRLVAEGRSALLYDADAFRAAALGFGATSDIFDANPPALAIALVPFGVLSEGPAFIAWTVLGIAAFLVAWAALLRSLRVALFPALVLTALPPLFVPLRETVVLGQAFLFAFALLVSGSVAAAVDARTGRSGSASVGAGIAFGALAILKSIYGVAMLGVALLRRRWRIAAVGLAATVPAIVGSVILVGADGWSSWWRLALDWRSRPESAVTAYQTMHSLLGRLVRGDPIWVPAPAVDAPSWLTPLWLLAAGVIGTATLAAIWRARWDGGPPGSHLVDWAIVVPPVILFAPIAEDYHYTLTLFPIVVAGGLLAREAPRAGRWIVYVLAAALLAGPWPFEVARVDGWTSVLHYPRVYGALLLWSVLMVIALDHRGPAKGLAAGGTDR